MSEFASLLDRPRASARERFRRRPCVFLAGKLYELHRRLRPRAPPPRSSSPAAATARPDAGGDEAEAEEEEEEEARPVSVVCVSDTHNAHARCGRPLPAGDVLVHAGDLTQAGSLAELQAAAAWLRAQPHRHKVVVAGNHDLLLDPACDYDHPKLARDDDAVDGRARRRRQRDAERARIDWGDVHYLCDSSASIALDGRRRRLKVYGSPRSPRNGNWAFQYPREDGGAVWDHRVPDDVDILVTHGPPKAHLDLQGLGCEHLRREVWRVRPKLRLHVFGHVHEGHGREWVPFDALQQAYEQTVAAGGGVWNLCKVAWAFAASLLRAEQGEARCQMVNAAMVGGLRDEVQRRPVTVYI